MFVPPAMCCSIIVEESRDERDIGGSCSGNRTTLHARIRSGARMEMTFPILNEGCRPLMNR
jgi:hypothetical protein